MIKRTAKAFITDMSAVALTMTQTTIPASQIVNITPSVISAGGAQLQTIGLFVTQSTAGLQGNRVPIGAVQSFASSTSVSNFFGATSHEAAMAAVYFTSYINTLQQPGALLFAQMPCTGVAAWLHGASIAGLTVPQIQGLSGSLSVVVDGYTRNGTAAGGLSLAAATSYSSAATLIASWLNQTAAGGTNQQSQATGSATLTQGTAVFTGYISGNVLNVTAMSSGTIYTGGVISSGTVVQSGTLVTGQLSITSGTASGGVGTYAVSSAQATGTLSITETYGLLNFGTGAIITGTFSVGQTITSGTASAVITQLLTGAGGTGTYITSSFPSQAITLWTAYPTPLTCSYDTVTGGIWITSGVTGAASTMAYAAGALATSLGLTQATGATISQGANPQTPGAFMSGVTAVTSNWATFTTAFEPDGGNIAQGFASKLAFATWATQSPQNQAFLYVAWDLDPGPTLTTPDTSSFAAALSAANYNGTTVVYEPTDVLLECFICGVAASINFNQTNGRITFAFKGQAGLTASVTNGQVAQNLVANGYNFYGAYATASQQFVFLYPGSMPGQWKFIDSYINQIWLNSGFQNALMTLLTIVPSIPYNVAGYTTIANALNTQIQAGLNFGAFRPGVVLSATEILAANQLVGLNIATPLSQYGWYLNVTDPGPTVRSTRGSPNVIFFYTDAGSIQQVNMSSIDLQ